MKPVDFFLHALCDRLFRVFSKALCVVLHLLCTFLLRALALQVEKRLFACRMPRRFLSDGIGLRPLCRLCPNGKPCREKSEKDGRGERFPDSHDVLLSFPVYSNYFLCDYFFILFYLGNVFKLNT